MSRLKKYSRSLFSGYITLGANILFTVASVPLALHYLPREEFGLWALVTQVAGYLMLVDLGMTASIARVLIDHKDRPAAGGYGSVVRTGWLVLVALGVIIVALGAAAGFGLPGLLDVPANLVRPFQLLVVGQGLLTGVLFFHRMYSCVLYAHQRQDVVNYANVGSFAVNLAVLWAGFHFQFGLYSLLAAHAAGMVCIAVTLGVATHRLGLMPPRAGRGRVEGKVFKELFLFGGDIFLLTLGLQLVSTSQVVIISRTLGLEAAAVWAVATKGFTMAQQVVWRLWDFSSSSIGEMIARDERPRLVRRFSEIYLVTASASVFVGLGVAVGNAALLETWTRGRIAWDPLNDALMAALLFTNSVTRLHGGLLGTAKNVGGMRYIYFLEGVLFVTLSFLVAPRWGISGILAVALAMNLLGTGLYGTHRTAKELGVSFGEVAWRWLRPALRYALLLVPVAALCHWLARPLPAAARLAVTVVVMGAAGGVLLWKSGLTPVLRDELRAALAKVRDRFKAGGV